MLLLLLSFVALDAAAAVVAVVAAIVVCCCRCCCCCCCCCCVKGAGQQQASQDFLGAGYNFFLVIFAPGEPEFSPAYLENLFQIKRWKIKLSVQDLHGNLKYGLLYQTYLEK
jgi:hypothetical protein